MGDEQLPRPSKKRRIPRACAACRRSKLRCDERRPCSRCANARTECVYAERPVDPIVQRLEKLEQEVRRWNQKLNATTGLHGAHQSPRSSYSIEAASSYSTPPVDLMSRVTSYPEPGATGTCGDSVHLPGHTGGIVGFTVREVSTVDVVTSGVVTEADARTWFETFFQGCVWFVSVLDRKHDNFHSLRSRSSILFDTILIIGARAVHGALSKQYQNLFHLLRQRTSDLVLRLSGPNSNASIEDIQALLIIAAYSDTGAVLCDVALRFSLSARLPSLADENLTEMLQSTHGSSVTVSITPATRVWYCIYVLDMILSLDGGKPASIDLRPSAARRVRLLARHPGSNAPDVRLLAQVELNAIRSAAHSSVTGLDYGIRQDSAIATLRGVTLDLDLWLSEWQTLVSSLALSETEHTNVQVNLRVQHAWATLVLHLRALTASGIDNIALMTDEQRALAISAKDAAEQHLQLVMTSVPAHQSEGIHEELPQRPYVASFKYAMEFVWAKNAFCVLIVLRLNILLGASIDHLMSRLFEAKGFLAELERVGMGASISYIRILTQIVEKCERAVNSSLRSDTGDGGGGSDTDFESYLPKEFMFEWDFPGIHLHYIPLDWQDLLFDIGIIN